MSEKRSNPIKRFLFWLSGAPDEAARQMATAAARIDPAVDPAGPQAPDPELAEAAPALKGAVAASAETTTPDQDTSRPEAIPEAGEEPESPVMAVAAAAAADQDSAEGGAAAGEGAGEAVALVAEANDAVGYGVAIVPADVPPGRPYWRAVRVHHLAPDENHGNHHIYLDALDEQGARVHGARARVTWDGGEQIITADKPAAEPGTNFPMWKWQICTVEMMNLLSDRVTGLHTGHPDEPSGTGNTLFHHSFAVDFQRAVKEDQTDQEPVPGAGSVIGGTVSGAAGGAMLLTEDGEIVARQLLDQSGAYRFEGLAAGDYVLAVEGTGTHSGVISVDGQAQVTVNLSMPASAAETAALFIDRYFLFGAPNSARTAVYLDLARSYLLSRQPTFGFRVADALHARQVVLMGAPEDISQETEETLRQAGCQVVRIQGTPQQIQDALRQMDIGGHQIFLPVVPHGS